MRAAPIAPRAAPAGVVTNCQAYGASGARGTGLFSALQSSPTISFDCDPTLSGGPGPYTIAVTGTITIATPTTIDGTDNNRDDVTISGGDAHQIFLVRPAAALTLIHLTLAHGNSTEGTGSGGAIEADGNLTVIGSTFRDNHANHLGGAIDIGSNQPASSPAVMVNGSTFVDNAAAEYGGAIEADANGATVRITNSTFVGNSAGGTGGAIRNAVATMTVANSTFSANMAPFGGALSNSGTLRIRNSILANNEATCTGFAEIADGGYNVEYPATTPSHCNFSSAHGDIFANPLLGALANNGGPTQTELPGAGSPAIHGGNPVRCIDATGHTLTGDQRDLPRPYPAHARCDIGAVEVQPFSALALISSANPTAIGQSVTMTATVGLTATSSLTPTGTITFSLTNPAGISMPLVTVPLTAQGQGSVTASGTFFPAAGTYSLIATYSGNRSYPGAAAAAIQVVRAAAFPRPVDQAPGRRAAG